MVISSSAFAVIAHLELPELLWAPGAIPGGGSFAIVLLVLAFVVVAGLMWRRQSWSFIEKVTDQAEQDQSVEVDLSATPELPQRFPEQNRPRRPSAGPRQTEIPSNTGLAESSGDVYKEVRFVRTSEELFAASQQLLAPRALSAGRGVRMGGFERVVNNLSYMLPTGSPKTLTEASGYIPIVYQTAAAIAFHWLDEPRGTAPLLQAALLTGAIVPNWCSKFLSSGNYHDDSDFEFTKTEFLKPYLIATSHLHLAITAAVVDRDDSALRELASVRGRPICLLDDTREFWSESLNSAPGGQGRLQLKMFTASGRGLNCRLTKRLDGDAPLACRFEGNVLIIETVQENAGWLLGLGDGPRCYYCSEEIDTDPASCAAWGVFLSPGDANFMIHPECFFYDMVQRSPTA